MVSLDFIPEAPTLVGLHKQLFVDDYIVAEKVNVSLEVGQAQKHGVVMEPTLLTEFQSGTMGQMAVLALNRISVGFSLLIGIRTKLCSACGTWLEKGRVPDYRMRNHLTVSTGPNP